MKDFDFENLFVFDMANNHQGDLEHGLNIVRAVGEVAREEGIKAALKFQFRQLDSFIHPAYRDTKENKHIPRFLSTQLDRDAYLTMTDAVREQGLYTMSTPFDEESVDVIGEQDIQIIKVASCSATDRPLLARIAEAGRPVVASTAGVGIGDIDHLVSFFDYKGVDFAIMHCVAIYPTPSEKLRLNQIDLLKSRYRHVPIGFSTHEDPDNDLPIRIAVSKGAKLFERHVGLNTEKYKLNAYSSTPEQLRRWIRAYKEAVAICGGENRAPAPPEELESLKSLRRGVYARRDIKKGESVLREDVYFAMPLQDSQLESGRWHDAVRADKNYAKDAPLGNVLADLKPTKNEIIYDITLQVKGMLNNARITIGDESSVEISHHYGLERFREFGTVIIDCVNREYCKKLLVMLPRQKHPYHYHKRKEETFQLLYGDMEIEANGHVTRLEPGDTFLVEAGTWHKFHTLDGAIVEEISTTHYKNDSFYEDERIAQLELQERKTRIPSLTAPLRV